MKKLFVVLPLILVMLLSSVSVMAFCNVQIAGDTTVKSTYDCTADCYVLYLVTLKPNCDGNKYDTKNWVFLNNGNYVKKFDMNKNLGEMAIALLWWQSAENNYAADYSVLSPFAQNVLSADQDVKVGNTVLNEKQKAIIMIVEPKFVNVEITHHVVADGKEATYLEYKKVDKNVTLTAKDGAKLALITGVTIGDKNYSNLKLDESKTKFSGATFDGGRLETVVTKYKYDLYYTAAKVSDDKKTDAATQPTTTAPTTAAGTPPAKLPATGAGDVTVALLAAVAMIVVGLFTFKKN